MGEEEKKPEEKKVEEKKPEEAKKPEEEKKEKKEEEKTEKPEKPSEEKKEEKKAEESKVPPPPEDIVLRVYMHCEGCARKVRRCLKGFAGVENVQTDCKVHKVIVKGKQADPLKVLERVQRKSHNQVELLSPIPKPPAEDAKKADENKENVKPEEKKEEPPQVIIALLKVHMHCEACAQEIRKRILRMKGIEEADPDLKSSQVTVKGVFDPQKLVEYVYKRTGKHAVIVKQEPENKKEEKGKEEMEEKKAENEVKEKGGGGEGEAKEKKVEEAKPETVVTEEEAKLVELKTNEALKYLSTMNYGPIHIPSNDQIEYQAGYQYPYPHQMEYVSVYTPAHIYNPPAPQIFSDENPNACSIM